MYLDNIKWTQTEIIGKKLNNIIEIKLQFNTKRKDEMKMERIFNNLLEKIFVYKLIGRSFYEIFFRSINEVSLKFLSQKQVPVALED